MTRYTTQYFGPAYARKPHEMQIATPVGKPCGHCEEPIEADDIGTMMSFVELTGATVRPVHHECTMRAVIGSLAHVEGRCSCFVPGAHEGDPPGMSRREAARAALAAYHAKQL